MSGTDTGSKPRRRYKLTLSYDGTAYAGWQIQPNGITVQGKIETALATLSGENVKLHGSGRTDSGVHARRQVAHCDLCGGHAPAALRKGLNALLPPDIRVLSVRHASPDFHARKSAVAKEYRYFIWNAEVVPPFLTRYRTQVRNPLDAAAMQRAAALLAGRRDFASFTANPNRFVESTTRRLTALQVRKSGSELVIVARGEGFLYKMVRSLAGWLIRVGEGRVAVERTSEVLDSREHTARVPTAPPEGLFLWNVEY